MEEPKVPVHRVLPRTGAGTLTAAEAKALLKIAFLAGEADGTVDDDEEWSFSDLAKHLRGLVADGNATLTDAALDDMLGAFGDHLDSVGRSTVLTELVPDLKRPLARDLAYKIAVAMSVADLDRRDEEIELEDEILELLGISDENARLLAGDVYAALDQE